MKLIFILFYLVSCSFSLFSQNTFRQNNIYFELGGNGLGYSLNYERQLLKKPGPGIRLGVGSYSLDEFQLSIPVGVNLLLNVYDNKVFLDLGYGVTYTKADAKLYISVKRDPSYRNTNYFNYIPSAGLRFHTSRNYLWRITLSGVVNDYGLIPWFGVSFGKIF